MHESAASPHAGVARELFLDLVPHFLADQLAPMLGFFPASPDVQECEHAASHERVDALEPIWPELALLAETTGEILARTMLATQGVTLTPRALAQAVLFYRSLVLAAVATVLANLLDKEVVHVDPEFYED